MGVRGGRGLVLGEGGVCFRGRKGGGRKKPAGLKVPHRVPHQRFILTFDTCKVTRHRRGTNRVQEGVFLQMRRPSCMCVTGEHACLWCLQVQKCVFYQVCAC